MASRELPIQARPVETFRIVAISETGTDRAVYPYLGESAIYVQCSIALLRSLRISKQVSSLLQTLFLHFPSEARKPCFEGGLDTWNSIFLLEIGTTTESGNSRHLIHLINFKNGSRMRAHVSHHYDSF